MGDGCDFAIWEEDQKRDQSKQLRVECALGYTPETPWMVEENLVYNLKWTGGWHKGDKQMCNDVAVHIDARLPKTVVADVANTICTALNRQYWNK